MNEDGLVGKATSVYKSTFIIFPSFRYVVIIVAKTKPYICLTLSIGQLALFPNSIGILPPEYSPVPDVS